MLSRCLGSGLPSPPAQAAPAECPVCPPSDSAGALGREGPGEAAGLGGVPWALVAPMVWPCEDQCRGSWPGLTRPLQAGAQARPQPTLAACQVGQAGRGGRREREAWQRDGPALPCIPDTSWLRPQSFVSGGQPGSPCAQAAVIRVTRLCRRHSLPRQPLASGASVSPSVTWVGEGVPRGAASAGSPGGDHRLR